MSSTPRASTMVALFLIGAIAAAVQAPVEAQEDPEADLQHFRNWSVGDHWRWEESDTPGTQAHSSGVITQRILSAERVTNDRFFQEGRDNPAWESHQAFRLRQWANMTTNTPQSTTVINSVKDIHYRTADLGQAKAHQRDEIDVTAGYGFDGGSERFREYYPPRMEFVFPFTVGDKWRVATETRGHNPGDDCGGENMPGCNSTNQEVFTYTVLAKQMVAMELNGEEQEILTYRIHRLDDLGIQDTSQPEKKKYQIWWWSPEVCNVVRKEQYDSRDHLEEVTVLKEYRCKGRQSPDPTYAAWDRQNLSATRLHGELAVPAQLAAINQLVERKQETGGGGLIQLGEGIPGPGPALLVLSLLGLAAATRRRERPGATC